MLIITNHDLKTTTFIVTKTSRCDTQKWLPGRHIREVDKRGYDYTDATLPSLRTESADVIPLTCI